ncbi:MAG: oxidoreductase [Bacteroidales bacterium]|jgi:short-subunit dehydrogenase|nr:oxidoreductase [Bacteroidales bacterium]
MKKVVFITGASSGIGKATTLHLLAKGYTVYGAARSIDKMSDISKAGGQVIHIDMLEEASMQKAVDDIIAREGRIDVLVNNAGYGSYGALEDVPLDEARRQFEVNVFGLMRLSQMVLPHMRKQKAGRIINISSVGGKIYMPIGGWYHATKHAVEVLSDVLRMEVKEFGIDVVIIQPGAIHSEWSNIAIENAMKYSGNTVYAIMAKIMGQGIAKSYEGDFALPAQSIAEVVEKAIVAKNPKTRYAKGKLVGLGLFGKRFLPDRWFDSIILFQMKKR